MKKILGVTLSLFCIVFLLFSFVFNTAYAETGYMVEMEVEGEIFKQNIVVETNKKLRVGRSFYDFVKEKLVLGFAPRDILNYISPNLGTAYYNFLNEKEIQPINAKLNVDIKNCKFDYVSGKKGQVFDEKEACLFLAKAMDGERQTLNLKEKLPDITVKDIKERTALMGKYTTSFSTSKAERKHNISLASSFIHGTLIKSGEEFSFNKIVGERTKQRGFKNAKIIADGEYIDGIGGGVCQVATTLYNAVLLSGLKVKTVSRHTFAPSYVSPSRDAMVSSYTDFCFVNDTAYDIYVFSQTSGDNISISIYGLKEYRIELESVKTDTVPYSNVDKNGNILSDITEKTLISAGFEGIKSELYVTRNGIKTKVRSDIYKGKNAIYE